MARDYGNKRPARRSSGAPQQFLVIVVTFVFGYLTASVFDINTVSHWLNTQVLAGHEQNPNPVKSESQHSQIPPKPKFEFYTLLANEKNAGVQANANPTTTHAVTRPVSATATTSAQVNNSTAVAAVSSVKAVTTNNTQTVKVADAKAVTSTAANKPYMVQVAAFKARPDAEHMKGMLILKGFDVNVVQISNPQGNWFRVVTGPYANRTLAQKAQVNLARNEHLRGMITGGV